MPLKLITSGGGSVILDANTTGSTYTINVPAEGGSLLTSGSLSGINASAMSVGTIPTTRLPTIPKANLPTGCILQVLSARNGDFFSSSSTSWADITGLSVTITPTSATSKVFVMVSFGRGTTQAYNLDMACGIRVLANGSDALYINGNTSSNRAKVAMMFNGLAFNADHSPGGFMVSALESPATTSAVTYKVQVACQAAANPFIMNGSPNNGDTGNIYHGRGQSSITVWEIAA